MRIPLLLTLPALFTLAESLPAQDKVEFNRDIRSVISENCYACHGPDKNKRKAELRLDDRAVAVKIGAIVPGKPAESELVRRIFSHDPDEMMPPTASHKTLSDKQKETLKKWISQGAEYQPHWAYMPIKRFPVPVTKYAVRNPVDNFVFAELEKRGIRPSPEADKRTLIRRVTLDLIGLPPTPEEVDDFLKDHSPNAYEKVVDRLLGSPHYGERMATPWLDLVRFADTVGYHGDQNQRIFPYRDYVIESFNANKPFDVFTREQLAGDLLPNPTTEQLVATGYNRLNMMTREGGAQPKEYIAKYQADRVRTLSMTWLGSTMGCCECHDHKFDPFKSKDFYSMEAFFADVKQWGVYSDYGYTPNPDLKGWTNDHPFPPEIEVGSDYLERRIAQFWKQIDGIAEAKHKEIWKTKKPARDEFFAWRESMNIFLMQHPTGWATPRPVVGANAKVEDGGVVVFSGKAVKGQEQKISLPVQTGWVAAVKLELLPHASHGGKITRNGAPSTTVQLALSRKAKDGKETKLKLLFGKADRYEVIRYVSTEPVLGLLNGWQTSRKAADKPQTAVWLLEQPIRSADGEQLVVTLKSDNLGCVRLSTSPFGTLNPGPVFRDNETPTFNDPNLDQTRMDMLQTQYLLGTGYDPAAFSQVKAIRKEILALNDGKAWTQVTVATTPITTRLLHRGNWMDETGAVLQPAVPEFLPHAANNDGRRLTRLDLANWIAAKDNPLTARVFVNRLWKQLFGTGLSAVMEDVGAQGEPPSHPELLDWIASEFLAPTYRQPDTVWKKDALEYPFDPGAMRAWDVKRVVRLLVLSATYRQDSKARPELKDLDPGNRLVSFLTPRRLEAEFVRDNALAAAGLLNTNIGGPSTFPYQPAGYYANIQFPDRKYLADTDDRQYRRGLYMHWQRTFLHPMLANFDAPSREECTANRPNANTPQQALTLLNDPTFVEAARVLAAKTRGVKDDGDRLDAIYTRVLARPAKEKEKQSLLGFLKAQRAYFTAHREDAIKRLKVGIAPVPEGIDSADLAAWAEVCRVVLNLHETITRY